MFVVVIIVYITLCMSLQLILHSFLFLCVCFLLDLVLLRTCSVREWGEEGWKVWRRWTLVFTTSRLHCRPSWGRRQLTRSLWTWGTHISCLVFLRLATMDSDRGGRVSQVSHPKWSCPCHYNLRGGRLDLLHTVCHKTCFSVSWNHFQIQSI